jgi:hypothetical protein
MERYPGKSVKPLLISPRRFVVETPPQIGAEHHAVLPVP